MKKLIITLLICATKFSAYAQIVEPYYPKVYRVIKYADSTIPKDADNHDIVLPNAPTTPQLFKSGFVNVLSDGTTQASARLLRINIGDSHGFYIPLFIYTGTSANTFGTNSDMNKPVISNLLNPVGGIANISLNNTSYLKLKKMTSKLSEKIILRDYLFPTSLEQDI